MDFEHKVQVSYLFNGERVSDESVFRAPGCQWAVNMARGKYNHLKDVRVERVWKETATGSRMAVNAWR